MRSQELDQRVGGARLDVGEHGLAVVDERAGACSTWPCGLTAPAPRPARRARARRGAGWQAVQPGQPVGAGDAHDGPVRQVDLGLAAPRAGAARGRGRRSAPATPASGGSAATAPGRPSSGLVTPGSKRPSAQRVFPRADWTACGGSASSSRCTPASPERPRRAVVRLVTPGYRVGVLAVLTRPDGRLLMVDQPYTQGWSLPGRRPQARRDRRRRGSSRELREEVGLHVAASRSRCSPPSARTTAGSPSSRGSTSTSRPPAGWARAAPELQSATAWFAPDALPRSTPTPSAPCGWPASPPERCAQCAPAAHSRQRPNTAKWPTSTEKPRSRSSGSAPPASSTPGGDLLDRAAVAADQVHVVVVGGDRVGRGAVPEVGVADQAELLEQLEGPVDGRDVDPGRRLAHRRDDLVRRGVAELADGLEHQLPLRRQPVAAARAARRASRARRAGTLRPMARTLASGP